MRRAMLYTRSIDPMVACRNPSSSTISSPPTDAVPGPAIPPVGRETGGMPTSIPRPTERRYGVNEIGWRGCHRDRAGGDDLGADRGERRAGRPVRHPGGLVAHRPADRRPGVGTVRAPTRAPHAPGRRAARGRVPDPGRTVPGAGSPRGPGARGDPGI